MKVLGCVISSRKPLGGPDSSVDYCGFTRCDHKRVFSLPLRRPSLRFPLQLAQPSLAFHTCQQPHLQFTISASFTLNCFVLLLLVYPFSRLPCPWLQILYEPLPSFGCRQPSSLSCPAFTPLVTSGNPCFDTYFYVGATSYFFHILIKQKIKNCLSCFGNRYWYCMFRESNKYIAKVKTI